MLDAVHHLRAGDRSEPSASAPVGFVPPGWKRQVKARDGSIDKIAYRLCLLEGIRTAIRRRDLFVSPSLRYADPRLGLLSGSAWEAARPSICRTLGLSADASAEITCITDRLDNAYKNTASKLPELSDVTIDGTELILSPLDKLDEPPSLIALKTANLQDAAADCNTTLLNCTQAPA